MSDKKLKDGEMAEADEAELQPEKPERSEPTPQGSAATLNKFIVGFAFFAALCIAASIYFLPPFAKESFLTKPVGGKYVNLMLGVALAVFGALSFVITKKLKPRLEYVKPGQGKWVRLTGYIAFGAIMLFGAVSLHRSPGLKSEWYDFTTAGASGVLASLTIFGQAFELRPIFFPAAAFFAVMVMAWHFWANTPGWVDFQVETQSEMRKVSWPATKEWTGSTIVVVVVMAFMAFFLYFADEGLSWLLERLKIGI